MYKRFIPITAIIFILLGSVFAQEPTKWTLSTTEKETKLEKGAGFAVTLGVKIDNKWKLYAMDQPTGGPVATTIKLPDGSNFDLAGPVKSKEPTTKFDPNFKIDTKFFEKETSFQIPLIARDGNAKGKEAAVDVRFQVCDDTLCLPPKTLRVSFDGTSVVRGSSLFDSSKIDQETEPLLTTTKAADQSIWSFIWLALTLGALSLLTPCVFPMIPITVSYFTKNAAGSRAKSVRLAFVYSAGIILTFTLLGMLLAIFVGAAGINLFAANPWVNIGIAGIFLFFALNLFGFYEIGLPTSWLNRLDKLTRTKEGEGSAYLGALLMGLTFTVTSFTCTSPFVGTILVSTSQGDWQLPLIGMLVFSTVFALPFFVLALAPQLVSQLPKSGGWLNSVKVVMGFLEIAAALKFLSNVDLVWTTKFFSNHASNYGTILNREVVLGLWIVIALLIAAYVLGFFKFKLDSPIKKIGPLRILVAGSFLLLSVYLATGFLGRKLGELESFLPPKNSKSVLNVLGDKKSELVWIKNDLPGALDKAKLENKKVFVDFTGYTCTNCRWMEANMFPVPEVKELMENYVLVGLYTDGDGELYYRQQQYQEKTFKTVALPFYAILDSNGKPLKTFPGLTRDSKEFIEFIK